MTGSHIEVTDYTETPPGNGRRYIDGASLYANGTVVITIKLRRQTTEV